MKRSHIPQYCLFLSACMMCLWASATVYAQSVVAPGYDLFTTDPSTTFAGDPFEGVPEGFFNFGGSIGTQFVGDTDTIVHRLGPASVVPPGMAAPIPIEMLALHLQSEVPANFGLGVGTYFVTLQSERGGPASTGDMTINFVSQSGGSFGSNIDVFFDVRLGSLSGPIAFSGDKVISSGSVLWTRVPPPGALTINGVNVNLNGSNMDLDFWPTTPFSESNQTPPPVIHIVHNTLGPQVVPDPGSLSLLIGAGLAAFGLLRRRAA